MICFFNSSAGPLPSAGLPSAGLPSAGPVKPRRPLGPPGFHTTARELQTCTFEGTGLQKHHQNSTRRPPERDREKERKWERKRKKKKREILGLPPSGPHPSSPHAAGPHPAGPNPCPRPFGPPLLRAPPFGPHPSSGGPPGLHFFWVWAPTFLIFIMLLICFFLCIFNCFCFLSFFFLKISLFLSVFSNIYIYIYLNKYFHIFSFFWRQNQTPKKFPVWGLREVKGNYPLPKLKLVWGFGRGVTTLPNPHPHLKPVRDS